MVLQEIEPESDRILAGGFGNLVEERLDGVGGVRRSDRAPPQHGDADLGRGQLDAQVRNGIGDRRRALDRGHVDAVLHSPLAKGVLATIDWPTILFCHAISRPSASSPALRLWTYIGR